MKRAALPVFELRIPTFVWRVDELEKLDTDPVGSDQMRQQRTDVPLQREVRLTGAFDGLDNIPS